ncbi:Lysophospholipase L1 or related esterase. Includes spore coat protein LipC/YcsK (TesA) (PDB:1BWP) [Commensalibacter communis]|uniref:Lysophospholipase L1 or related esterase. Includes spore coat protein LipC/YcsK (TesA) n=1 Tax=Commensalibacter communis TaxID=2972786 RepID=A0A9W4TN06_9PROT|nr:SGNH/GDSL hydrolase family protein [Commensalibacter communis]CAI3937229.1 Lysophospholipase L1 or related esterase. Includes spore coat protein LipC/YcsK (TesA) (PDB:1BWP) [Commensalibacter communis]CAI3939131.1 Lysophospholipase L1 or related esterase. Includes spore coat protein LipC/YcsK (TesA) (PDB:1BWP) [Commensalibacter communis]CAI3941012.1 Lysophospholipase L1 or related esterase. Includes spore coat protein LipC/YcsK (TesA) (PDB:1BWP) [Commensalibacter communis]CAI3941213.1 Lysopho
MQKKTILFYGDSNTHGTKPMSSFDKSERFTSGERWIGILQNNLKQYHIIEEGLPGRTTVHDDPIEGKHKNGLTYLRPCLESHTPIDIFVLMLGTNDLKTRFSVTAADISYSINQLISEIKTYHLKSNRNCPKIILLCPPPIKENRSDLSNIFAGGEEKSKSLHHFYQKIAQKHDLTYLDIGSVVTVSEIDGIHYDLDEQVKLAHSIQKLIENL